MKIKHQTSKQQSVFLGTYGYSVTQENIQQQGVQKRVLFLLNAFLHKRTENFTKMICLVYKYLHFFIKQFYFIELNEIFVNKSGFHDFFDFTSSGENYIYEQAGFRLATHLCPSYQE